MFRFQYSVVTQAEPGPAWEVFSDSGRWNLFVNVYAEIAWREGRPWQAGSRMEIEIFKPLHARLDHVITSCIPARRVGWIDHALGAAMAQWVTFESQPSGGTRVHTWGDLIHSGRLIAGHSAEQLIVHFTKVWYENFRAYCDLLARGAALHDFTPPVLPACL